MATTFISWANADYSFQVQRFMTRLHTGQVAPQEVTQIANDTAAAFQGNGLAQAFGNMSVQDRQQERLDGIEAYKAKAKTIEEVTGIELVG